MSGREGTVINDRQHINQARLNLENVLLNISDHKLTSPVGSGDESIKQEPGEESSPRKKAAGKKRKRPISDLNQSHTGDSSRVVTLFDRSLDIAGYSENAPLYSMCREWLRNTASDQPIVERCGLKQETSCIDLPAPTKTADENLSSLRIPEPIKFDAPPLDIYAEPEDAKELLIKHLQHWKKVKHTWMEANRKYETNYGESFSVIKQLYEATTSP